MAIPISFDKSDADARFLDFAREHGLNITRFDPDDRSIKRCGLFGYSSRDERGTDGAYQYWRDGKNFDGRPNGWVQNFKSGEGVVQWQYRPSNDDLRATRLASERESEAARAEAARARMLDFISRSLTGPDGSRAKPDPASPENPYLVRKGIGSYLGTLWQNGDILIVPYFDILADPWKLTTIETIGPAGKKNWAGLGFGSSVYAIAGDPNNDRVFIGEGVATVESAASALLPQNGGQGFRAALCAGSVSRLRTAINVAIKAFPGADIYLLADDDHKRTLEYRLAHPGEFDPARAERANAGLTAAKGLATLLNGVLVPPFRRAGDDPSEGENGLSDWNDFAAARGLAATTEALEAAVSSARVHDKERQRKKSEKITPEMAAERRENGIAEKEAERGKPVVDLARSELDAATDAVIAALIARTPGEDSIYRFGRDLARLIPVRDRLETDVINEMSAPLILARAVCFVRSTARGDINPTDPTDKLIRSVLSNYSADFPELRGITRIPILHDDGSIFTARGYDPQSMLYHDAIGDIEIPGAPTHEDAISALSFIREELLCDFPFQEPSDMANALGLMLTAVIKNNIGLAPLAMLNASDSGYGKSYYAQLVGAIMTGAPIGTVNAANSPEEWRKQITSWLLAGKSAVVIDNIALGSILKDANMANLLTTNIWEDRELGRTKMLSIENTALFMATGINIRVSKELQRRVYEIRLDARTDDPTSREFKRADLIEYAIENRVEILKKLFTTIRAWYVAGCPRWHHRPIAGYAKWSNTIGGILDFCGLVDETGASLFLANTKRSRRTMSDGIKAQWGALFEFIYKRFKDRPDGDKWRASYIADEFVTAGSPFAEYIPDDLRPERDGKFNRPLGKKLAAFNGAVFSTEIGKLRLEQAEITSNGTIIWHVVQED